MEQTKYLDPHKLQGGIVFKPTPFALWQARVTVIIYA